MSIRWTCPQSFSLVAFSTSQEVAYSHFGLLVTAAATALTLTRWLVVPLASALGRGLSSGSILKVLAALRSSPSETEEEGSSRSSRGLGLVFQGAFLAVAGMLLTLLMLRFRDLSGRTPLSGPL